MSELTEEDRQAIRDLAARFAREEIAPRVHAYDAAETFPADLFARMGELGLTGGVIPETYGGAGLDYVTYSLVLMELSRHCQALAGAATWASGVAGASLLRFGTEEQKQRYLVPLAQGRTPVAFALTESHTGSDVASMRMRARRTARGYVLNGTKSWISMAQSCGFILVFARTDPDAGARGITAFLLPADTPGVSRSVFKGKLGFRPLETGEIVFDDVELPEDSRLGQEGEGMRIAMCSVEAGRLGVSARCCGMIRGCLEESVAYARSRTTFGAPIASRQIIQQKIAAMVEAEATARLLTLDLAAARDRGEPARAKASLTKLHASRMAMQSAHDAVQIHGAYGVSEEYPVSRWFRDAKVMEIIEGANEIHVSLVAEYALGIRR